MNKPPARLLHVNFHQRGPSAVISAHMDRPTEFRRTLNTMVIYLLELGEFRDAPGSRGVKSRIRGAGEAIARMSKLAGVRLTIPDSIKIMENFMYRREVPDSFHEVRFELDQMPIKQMIGRLGQLGLLCPGRAEQYRKDIDYLLTENSRLRKEVSDAE